MNFDDFRVAVNPKYLGTYVYFDIESKSQGVWSLKKNSIFVGDYSAY